MTKSRRCLTQHFLPTIVINERVNNNMILYIFLAGKDQDWIVWWIKKMVGYCYNLFCGGGGKEKFFGDTKDFGIKRFFWM